MADTQKVTNELVIKFTLLSEDGTGSTTRSITLANPKSTAQVKAAARNFAETYGVNAEGTNANMIQPTRWEDENVTNIGGEPWVTQGIQFTLVSKTETFLDIS